MLFETPVLICANFILGGIVLLMVDRMALDRATARDGDPPKLAFAIGVCQSLAMIPGVSRSGATIVGALLLGTDKRSAAEFSFFLAMPTMAGAFAYDLYKNWAAAPRGGDEHRDRVPHGVAEIIVVRYLLDYVSATLRAVPGGGRILVGGMGLGALAVLG